VSATDREAAQAAEAEATERRAVLEAEAVLLLGRIRTAADAGNVDETIRLHKRIGELRLELLGARYVVARQARKAQRTYGYSPDLERSEHALAELLATLGVDPGEGLRRVFG
jgi:hypothetical protein